MQGEFAQLLIDEKENVTWQSVVRNVPRGILSFALRSVTNTLPSPDNLRRWGKRNVSKCPLCSNNGTLEHILNFCTVALNQGRLTWRHNSVLQFLAQSFISKKPSELEVYADLDGLHLNGSTIPPDIVPTQQRPDLVIINRKEKLVFIIELTICFERNFEAANARKAERYQHLKDNSSKMKLTWNVSA